MRRGMAPRQRAISALLTALLLLAGCGGDPASVTDKDATLRVEMDEYRFEPQNLTVHATALPMRIHVVAKNTGALTHNLVIESVEASSEQGTSADSNDPVVFLQTDTAHPGDTVSKSIALWPGTYRITCSIGNHDNLGMYGKLVVLPPAKR
jgi:plastocyanin